MARIKQPQLPAGALNDFFTALHNLHLKAGYPSTREIKKDIGQAVVSHTTIHKAFSGPRLLGWGTVELLVEALARRSRQDDNVVIEQFKSIWEAAAKPLPDNPEVTIDKIRQASEVVREVIQHQPARSFAELMIGTLSEIEAAGTRKIGTELVPTGFSDVDALTGGMRPGSLIIVGSRPSIGKSMLLTTMCATTAIRYEIPTALFSYEMTEREIQMRILSAESRVPYHSLRSGMMTDEDWARLAKRMSKTADAPLWLSCSPKMNIEDLENEARTLSNVRHLRFLTIDNIDALTLRAEEPDQILYRLKQLAVDLHMPILGTTRTRQQKASTHLPPKMSDLLHAEPVEAIADILILLDRPDAYDLESPRAGEIDLIFAKNRLGPTATVTLAFQQHYSRVVDLFISEERPDWSFKTSEDSAGQENQEAAPND